MLLLTQTQEIHEIEQELHVEILPGTEVMADVGSHHFVKGGKEVLIPQPSSDPHDPLVNHLFVRWWNREADFTRTGRLCGKHSASQPPPASHSRKVSDHLRSRLCSHTLRRISRATLQLWCALRASRFWFLDSPISSGCLSRHRSAAVRHISHRN